MDANENIHLYSMTSPFHVTSSTVDKTTVFESLHVIEYPSAPTPVRSATIKVSFTTSDPSSAPDPDPAQLTRTPLPHKPADLMHKRLCHPSAERMRLLGILYKLKKCQICVMGKQTKKPFPTNPNPRSTRKLFRVYSDICPVSPKTFGHGLYFITFVDEATQYVWIYIIPNKSSTTVLTVLKQWLPLVQNQSGTTLINFRTDEGGEYLGKTLQTVSTFLQERGITHEQTSAYSSSSNGVAERMNRTLMDMVRTMMITSKLPAPFWGEAVHTAVKVRNRLPTSSLEGNISPHQAWFNVAPELGHLRVFGCLAYFKVHHPRSKISPRGQRCCFLGYDGNTQYRIYDPASNKVKSHIRNIEFFEDEFLEPHEFAQVPYADRPLITPEPRLSLTEEEEDDLYGEPSDQPAQIDTKSEPVLPAPQRQIHIPMPEYLPAPAPAPVVPFRQPQWLIPPPHAPIPPRPSTDSSDSDSDAPPSQPNSRPTSQYGTPRSIALDSPRTEPLDVSRSPSPEQPLPSAEPIIAPAAPAPQQDTDTRRSGRPTKPTEKKIQADAEAKKKADALAKKKASQPRPRPTASTSRPPASTSKSHVTRTTPSLVAHTGPSFHSSSPYYIASYAPPEEPHTLQEAMESPYAAQWTEAILVELDSMDKHGTYTIVARPRNRKVVGSRYAFKIKNSETANPRFKVRFVAKGYTQVPHVDYEDTFAPVAKATSIRLVLSIAGGRRQLINLFDVETAFLNSTIDREIYIEQPEGFEDPDYPREEYVLAVNKGIYGLKQSGSLYAEDQKAKLITLGFTPSDADECIYISADKRIIVATYVDDGLVTAETQEEIDWVISELGKDYTIRNLGPPTKFLGMDISRPQDDPHGPITVSQSTYARKLLAKFGMESCNPVKAPCDQRAAYLHIRTDDEPPTDSALYRSITSSILHLSIWTRPDIAWITNKLCQFNSDPSELHMSAAKHLLRYIQGTLDYAFTYSPSECNSLYGHFTDHDNFDFTPLHGYSDASGASDPDDRCSTSGYIFFYYGGPIAWGSRKQRYAVALSTMEGEYLALTEAAKEAIFLRNLLASVNVPQDQPTLILTDSDAALKHVKNNVNHSRTKHIDTRHHFIRHAYNTGNVDIRHVPSASQTADVLTKPLGTLKHQDAIKLLQLHDTRYA
jgi:transposase InsO family protein